MAIVWFLLAGTLSSNPVSAAGHVLKEVREGREFQGKIESATYDRHGVAWIATFHQLFRLDDTSATLVDSSGSRDRRLAMAPGGERYAWMDNRRSGFGKFSIELMDLSSPGTLIADLKPSESPLGYHALQFSREGKRLIGATAISDQEGLRGDFRYLFWSANGQLNGSVTLAGHRVGISDDQGDSIVFLGESDAAAFRMDGIPLWTVKGKFLKGTLANAGNAALLTPASEVNAVRVVQSGTVASAGIRMLAPVHELAMTPDGTLGAVATRAGRISIVDLRSCTTGSCATRQLPQLPILSTHYITAIRFISQDTVVIGVIQATGKGREKRFYGGAVLVLKTSGELLFQKSIGYRELTTWSPRIDVAFGNPVFTAYTPNTAIFVRVDN